VSGTSPWPGLWEELAWRGGVAQSTDPESLQRDLAAGPVTLYCGFDPTAPSLHIGHLVQLLTLRRFQRAGHRPLALVGGATGLIGDPRPTAERTLNSPETVQEWTERIRAQVSPFLDLEGPGAALVVNNLDWLGGMSALEFLRDVGKHFRVNRLLAKESIAARLQSEHGISYTEFSYQLLQAADYLELYRRYGCRLQTGGADQWGNLTSGVDLLHRVEQVSVHALSTPLVTKADGTKFGKTESGTVWLDPSMTSPYAFFQFWLNSDDRDVVGYLKLFTDIGPDDLAELQVAVAERPQARAAQRRLARELTTLVHGEPATAAVEGASAALFGGGDLRALDPGTLGDAAAELPHVEAAPGTPLAEVLAGTGLSPSRSAARRSIGEGAISVNNEKASDPEAVLAADQFLHGRVALLRRGRRALAAAMRAPG
jgi:tyrosyl-tRNA synthetase